MHIGYVYIFVTENATQSGCSRKQWKNDYLYVHILLENPVKKPIGENNFIKWLIIYEWMINIIVTD